MNDLTKKYNKVTIATHWLSAVLIIILFIMGKYMEDLSSSEKMNLITVHIILGIIVFIMTLFRSWSYFSNERPTHIKTGSKFNDKLAVSIHNTFYALLYIVSFFGLTTTFTGGYFLALQSNNPSLIKEHSEISAIEIHGFFSTIMIVLVVLHIGGVLKHIIMNKENIIKRIS